MVGHARLACDGAGHWMSRLARAEQVSQREEVKGAASENKRNSIADLSRQRAQKKREGYC